MSRIEIRKASIVDMETDAIVNSANAGLKVGGGVCGAIFFKAGYTQLQDACDRIGHCEVGSAVMTPGFRLKARYIIHAVGPYWQGGNRREAELLRSAYVNALRLAVESGCRSIAFPLISSGIYGYPKEEAWQVALAACHTFLEERKDWDMTVVFAVISDAMLESGQRILWEIAPETEETRKQYGGDAGTSV